MDLIAPSQVDGAQPQLTFSSAGVTGAAAKKFLRAVKKD
jgi:hypothetical protein